MTTVLLAAAAGAAAQSAPPALAAAAARLTPAQLLERARAQLAASRQREAALRDEVLDLNRQADARVGELVSLLKGVRDSTESKTEVMNTKKEAIAGLEKWVQLYAQERGRRLGQLQRGGTAETEADLRQEIAGIEAEMDPTLSPCCPTSWGATWCP